MPEFKTDDELYGRAEEINQSFDGWMMADVVAVLAILMAKIAGKVPGHTFENDMRVFENAVRGFIEPSGEEFSGEEKEGQDREGHARVQNRQAPLGH